MKENTIQSLRPGAKLKSYKRTYNIVKVLGCGSFGITYLATSEVFVDNISVTMKFAIKEHFISASCYRGEDGATVCTVPTAKSDVVDSRADFITEANRLKKLCLKSRNIVSVNETFEANGTAYYVMEFLDGGSPSKCSEEEAVSIVLQVSEALKEIHKEHVLHLDLKPDNIVLKTNDKNETYPVLIDFGISKHFDSKGRPTSSLSAKGASPGYAPQEQYAGVSEFSPKYDIYALGAVLFYLCTGKNPPDAFKVTPNQQELKKELAGKVSDNIEKAILGAMRPTASERTPSIKQFCDDMMGIDFIPVLNVSDSNIEFGKDKSRGEVTVDSNIGWSVYSDEDWCNVSKKGNDIVISVSRNKESGKRSCNVVVNGSSYQISQVIKIRQEGVGTLVFPSGPSWWQQHSKIVYQVGGFILAGCLIGGISLLFNTNSKSESVRLTKAIKVNNGQVLKEFAEKDSVRAYLPYARFLAHKEQYEEAVIYAQKTHKTPFYIYAVALIDSINNILKINVNPTEPIRDSESQKSISPEFVLIESDAYNYKWWNEKSQTEHNIVVPVESYYISKYELTQSEYERVMGVLKNENVTFGVGEYGGDPYKQIKGDSIPVIASLKEIADYCNKRSLSEGYKGFYNIDGSYVTIDKDGTGYRLPTEVEWLFAAHGGNKHEQFKYSGSNKLGEVAWYGGNSGRTPHPVGQKKPNGIGLYDMTGNVDEYLWSSTFDGSWYPHPYMNYYMWVGTIDEIVGSQESLGARIVLDTGNGNKNLKLDIPVIPYKMKNLK